ncbi:hypothetical protein MN116_006159 [Schistosoma mekongi]|uniref:C2H2-type domain-containing protein n=1 Tax=Schistosoma mekongi TaxID=38744 RepID=A0AAE1ZBE3_SCHME|nr:hypothetical protein MN116_006159 [Schistosoma mekongi]
MSLDDVISDHESNQCLFVCTKCGAEYVTRDMLAMHMMDSARAGMCIETDAVNHTPNVTNSTNHKITLCEDLVDSDKLVTQKHNETSNIFNGSLCRPSLSNWMNEQTEPMFNILFNQLTLPHLYSIQNSSSSISDNNINSIHTNPANYKFRSTFEGNVSSFRGCRINRDHSSSFLDIQNNKNLQNLLLNFQYPTSSISPNTKTNFVQSLKVNKSDVYSKSTVTDSVRTLNEKSISNDCKTKVISTSDEMLTCQPSVSPVYSLIKALAVHNDTSNSSYDISKSKKLLEDIEFTNEHQRSTNTMLHKSQKESQESSKVAASDSKLKCIESHKISKCRELFGVNFDNFYDNYMTVKRSRSLPSPRALRNQQVNCEMACSVIEENSKLLKTKSTNDNDDVLHKTQRDRRCYKKSGFKNLRKFMNYNRSKFTIPKNSHLLSGVQNCHYYDKVSMDSGHFISRQFDTNDHNINVNEINNQKISKTENYQMIFPYICEYCQIGFVQQALYCLHMGMHCVNNPFKCNMCAQTCLDVYDFIGHTLHF